MPDFSMSEWIRIVIIIFAVVALIASRTGSFKKMKEAKQAKREGRATTILFNLCGHGHFDMQAYMDYFAGNLQDLDYDEGELAMALAGLPSVAAE